MKASEEEQKLRQRTLGRYVKAAREQAGLTQYQLAKALSYTSAQFISNWERGQSSPPLDVLPKLASVLDLSPKELLETLHDYQTQLLALQKKQLIHAFKKKFPGVR